MGGGGGRREFPLHISGSRGQISSGDFDNPSGAAWHDCRHNPKKTETAGTFAVSGEGCPDRAIQKVHLPADEHRSSHGPAVDEVLFDGAHFGLIGPGGERHIRFPK